VVILIDGTVEAADWLRRGRDDLKEHRPHGKEHDQDRHGAWADGKGGDRDAYAKEIGVSIPEDAPQDYVSGPGPGAGSVEKTCAVIRDQIRHLDREVGYIVAPDGEIRGGIQGDASNVRIGKIATATGDRDIFKDSVLVHNHPSKGIQPLSDRDLFVAFVAGMQEVRAVAPNGTVFKARPKRNVPGTTRDDVFLAAEDYATESWSRLRAERGQHWVRRQEGTPEWQREMGRISRKTLAHHMQHEELGRYFDYEVDWAEGEDG